MACSGGGDGVEATGVNPLPEPAHDARTLAVRVLKLTLMLAAVLWTLAYRLHLDSSGIPDFVYVNF